MESVAQVSETPVAFKQETNTKALAAVTSLFVAWGFLTALNDILIPHLRGIFHLNYFQSMLVQFVSYSCYFLFAVPAGKLIDRVGYKNTMVLGLLLMAAGALGFIPAANVPSHILFLAALMILASGMTLLQVSANPYVTALGPAQTASSRLSLSQGFCSLAKTSAPLLGALFILGGGALSDAKIRLLTPLQFQHYQRMQASTVKLPYFTIAMILLLLAALIRVYRLPAMQNTSVIRIPAGQPFSKWKLLKSPRLLMGVIGIFLYVGAEVSVGSFLANYISQPQIGNISITSAARLISYYWGGDMIGRFLGSAIMRKLPAARVLSFAATGAASLVIISMLSSGWLAVFTILLVGLFNSVMFPTIFALSLEGQGQYTSVASSLLVTAIVGGAILPALQGLLADAIGIHLAFILPLACYVYVLFFALRSQTTARRRLLQPLHSA